ncbi:MAG: HlyD family efflux transporter periplasmic adaptor subunit [Flammeovirgaceae bacterium]|nr:HlyD family efflux transporter periplasmic adaptor subunit [Flammeovirgaceae bacterium]
MNKKILIPAIAVLVLAIIYFFWGTSSDNKQDITVTARKGPFEIAVNTTGELEALNSVMVQGPSSGLRAIQVWEVKISKLVPEGTVVKKGQKIGELDKSSVVDKLRARETELTKAESQFTQTKLDTALTLRKARDNLVDLEFAVEEKRIVLEQSQFEPPATIKQAEIELEKAKRAFEQASSNYKIEVDQAVAKMQEVHATLSQEQRSVDFMKDLLDEFVIQAPEDGMVIYARDWDGRKKKEGSTMRAWDPTVATLPDLTSMISKTYINEVDIMKIQKGQIVKIGLDAFPDKKMTGEVISVANMGEQKPNSDAKVFEVTIKVNESDTTLRPAMTTSNIITCETVQGAVFLPLECLHTQGDSISYVFKKDGLTVVKQQIIVGKTNENEAIVEMGIDEGDICLLSTPEGRDRDDVILLNMEATDVVARKNDD